MLLWRVYERRLSGPGGGEWVLCVVRLWCQRSSQPSLDSGSGTMWSCQGVGCFQYLKRKVLYTSSGRVSNHNPASC